MTIDSSLESICHNFRLLLGWSCCSSCLPLRFSWLGEDGSVSSRPTSAAVALELAQTSIPQRERAADSNSGYSRQDGRTSVQACFPAGDSRPHRAVRRRADGLRRAPNVRESGQFGNVQKAEISSSPHRWLIVCILPFGHSERLAGSVGSVNYGILGRVIPDGHCGPSTP